MKATDPAVKWIEEPKLGLAGKLYLPLFVQGLTTTFKHLAKSLGGGVVTVSYPDQEPEFGNPLIYRGVHRLNRDESGRVKCVACFLCATACPLLTARSVMESTSRCAVFAAAAILWRSCCSWVASSVTGVRILRST